MNHTFHVLKFHNLLQILSGYSSGTLGKKDCLSLRPETDLPGENKASGVSFRQMASDPMREVNLIGLRVEEALSVVDKVIDKTMIEGDLSVRIIHGYGTGKLKKAVREHLKGYPCVKKICGADAKSGGEAITIVELS